MSADSWPLRPSQLVNVFVNLHKLTSCQGMLQCRDGNRLWCGRLACLLPGRRDARTTRIGFLT